MKHCKSSLQRDLVFFQLHDLDESMVMSVMFITLSKMGFKRLASNYCIKGDQGVKLTTDRADNWMMHWTTNCVIVIETKYNEYSYINPGCSTLEWRTGPVHSYQNDQRMLTPYGL